MLANFVVVIIVFLDQLTKIIALKSLSRGISLPVIPNIFHLTLVKNTGTAFGLLLNQTFLFTVISIITCAAIVIYLKFPALLKIKHGRKFTDEIAFCLILGGAIGNLIDRIRLGYVVDFLDFRVWPVFNVADSAITIGAVVLAWNILKSKNVSHTI